jgi:sugar phosphate isomerase/epimerase
MTWSLQLYSARETPLEDSLEIIAKAGYQGIEAYRDSFADSDAFKAMLDRHQLKLPSMHINIQPLRDEFQVCLKLVREFSCQHIVCPYLETAQRPKDAQAWRLLAQELSDLAKRWRDADCQFAWHNHDFEFIKMVDGSLPMELLLEHAPEMQWEADLAWMIKANSNPQPWIENHSNRISAVHLKDIAPEGECEDEDGWADLGAGIVPWNSLLESLKKTSASMYCMEHDNPSDLTRFATRSIDYANREL